MSDFYFFSLTRPEHCWPFISSSYQASLPNVRCSLPKFDSKILIALNALQRDSNMRSPRTPAYGPFSNGSFFGWFLRKFEGKKSGATYRSRDLKKKKMQKKAKRLLFSAESEKRGLNLMRSMQQGISTHYNTLFGI